MASHLTNLEFLSALAAIFVPIATIACAWINRPKR